MEPSASRRSRWPRSCSLALVLAARIARRTHRRSTCAATPDARLPPDDEPNHLRPDDLLFIAVAAIPGAVAGGRIGYVMLHLDYYSANPARDPRCDARAAFELSLAVVGGALSGGRSCAGLLGAPVGRWMHARDPAAAVRARGRQGRDDARRRRPGPAVGRRAGRRPTSAPGPWGSLAPELPSHPSQAYEAFGDRLS